MKYRQIPNTDLNVSTIGLGTWVFSGSDWGDETTEQSSIDIIHAAGDEGVNFIDCAPIYGWGEVEKIVGKALKGRRDKYIVATKGGLAWTDPGEIFFRCSRRKSLQQELNNSLKSLGVDYIDLYQIHWPDFQIGAEGAMDVLNDFVKQGKIRNIGVANFPVCTLDEYRQFGPVVSSQVLFNMIDRNADFFDETRLFYHSQDEVMPYCEKNNVAVIPYAPLCQGLLTGTYSVGTKLDAGDIRMANPNFVGERFERNLRLVSDLKGVANEIGKPLSQLAINWLLKFKPVVSVIAGSTNVEYLRDNIRATDWEMDDATFSKCNNLIAKHTGETGKC